MITIVAGDDVINNITECLIKADNDFIELIANQVLPEKIEYIGDDLFELEEVDNANDM